MAELTTPRVRFTLTRLLVGTVSKLVPLTVTLLPTVPTEGVKLVMVGTPEPFTVKGVVLVAVPPGVVTVIAPVVAPAGTVVLICVAVAALTVAAVPLKVTVLSTALALKPVP